ncbi:MAG: leucine-rich repeat domain-containing protein [Candidatus Thorarchaeota archaeon]|nr:leucine-rich repeat domain-containing protein [Candidatus Thorarchaeota archaeon]
MVSIRVRFPAYGGFQEIEIPDDAVEFNFNQDQPYRNATKVDLTGIEKCKKLKSFNISRQRLRTIDLELLAECRDLEYLDISYNKISSLDLSVLNDLPNLREINASNNAITQIELPSSKTIEILNLSNNAFGTEIASLSHLPNLKQLYLANTNIISTELFPLASSKKLEILHLDNNPINQLNLESLKLMRKLRVLKLNNTKLESFDLSPLTGLKFLENLDLSNTQITQLDLKPLSKCNGFKQLHLANVPIIDLDLSPLSNSLLNILMLDNSGIKKLVIPEVDTLIRLSLSKTPLKTLDLSPLGVCKEFYHFHLNGTSLVHIDLSPLSRFPKLTGIKINRSKMKTIVLPANPNIQEIDLERNMLESIDLEPLANNKNLRKIRISHNKLYSVNLSPLTTCSQLRQIDISRNRLKEIHLPRILSLKFITIRNNRLTSLTFDRFSKRTKLEDIYADDNRLTSVDFTPISKKAIRYSFSKNRFTELDLNIFSNLSELVVLDFSDNNIQKIDFTPLQGLDRIWNINLSNNQLVNVDVSPLDGIIQGFFRIGGNPIKEIDVSPLWCNDSIVDLGEPVELENIVLNIDPFLLQSLNEAARRNNKHKFLQADYATLVKLSGSNLLQKRLKDILIESSLTQAKKMDIIRAFGFDELRGFDGDIRDFLLGILGIMEYSELSEKFHAYLINGIRTQIEHGGSTLFFDVEKMGTTEAAILIPPLLEQRKREMSDIRIPEQNGVYDLRPLLYTGYGLELTTSLNLGVTTNKERYDLLQEALYTLGFKIQIETDLTYNLLKSLSEPYPIKNMSAEMRDYIPRFLKIQQLRENILQYITMKSVGHGANRFDIQRIDTPDELTKSDIDYQIDYLFSTGQIELRNVRYFIANQQT